MVHDMIALGYQTHHPGFLVITFPSVGYLANYSSYLGCLTGLQGGHGHFCVLVGYLPTYPHGSLVTQPHNLPNHQQKYQN